MLDANEIDLSGFEKFIKEKNEEIIRESNETFSVLSELHGDFDELTEYQFLGD